MTEAQLIEKHGTRLRELLGDEYRSDPRYRDIVRQASEGNRTLPMILADYAERDPQTRKSRSSW